MVPIPLLKAEWPDPRPTKLRMNEMLHLTGSLPPVSSCGPRDGVDHPMPVERGAVQASSHIPCSTLAKARHIWKSPALFCCSLKALSPRPAAHGNPRKL